MFSGSPPRSGDAPLLWMELFDHAAQESIDSSSFREIDDAVSAFDDFGRAGKIHSSAEPCAGHEFERIRFPLFTCETMICPDQNSAELRYSLTAPISTPPPGRSVSTSITSACSRNSRAAVRCCGVLLHRDHRGSGIHRDPSPDRLARLQRLHRRHQADQGVHRRQRPAQGQGQHGHRTRGRCDGNRRPRRSRSCCFPAMAISARWSRRCSAVASASPWCRRLRASRRWLADELRRQADVFIDLADLQTKIGREPGERSAARDGWIATGKPGIYRKI